MPACIHKNDSLLTRLGIYISSSQAELALGRPWLLSHKGRCPNTFAEFKRFELFTLKHISMDMKQKAPLSEQEKLGIFYFPNISFKQLKKKLGKVHGKESLDFALKFR